MDNIRYHPTEGMCYNPNEPLYWRRDALRQEITRVYEVCHGCRLCFKYCQSFPVLFDAVDANEGDVTAIPSRTTDDVIDHCFQCQLCYVNCPYTPGENHEFQLDFPKLILRAKAVRAKERGIPLRDRLLADPVGLGKLAQPTAALANWGNTFKPLRLVMEKTLGIHRDKQLPEFHGETFAQWFAKRAPKSSGENGMVVLFNSCFVNYNGPRIGKAVVEVLARNRFSARLAGADCCGMPRLDSGDVEAAQLQARRNVEALYPLAQQGLPIAVVNPTCSMMLKREYPELLRIPGDAIHEWAKAVAANTFDMSEFLLRQHRDGKLDRSFESTPGTVAYQVPCHLKTQNIGFPSRDLLRTIPGCRVRLVNECSGHDGTWAMRTEHYDESIAVGKKAFDGMKDAEASVWATDCPLAAVQIEQHAGKKPLHPFEILAMAYRPDGFPEKVQRDTTEG
ncbi:anaerobic glycerol-3-phosphate dehydrogenase subunit C [Candidatus Poribacteria bacterium]|nr:anaerobic glycerol-3-phosphate dehydrogenase subunit C [Candidatus Poribacteria bacterium]